MRDRVSWPPRDTFAVLFYALVAALLNAPILTRFASAIPADVGDPLLNTWILWWNAHAAPWSASYWNAPAFAPAPSALALSETLLGLTVLTTPLQWLGAAPLVAYNALFVITPWLNAICAYALCRSLTGRRDAAFIGGLYFMLAPYRAAQLPHLQTLATFYMPLALLGLHAYWRTGRGRWLACLFLATVANGLVSGYHLVYFGLPLGLTLVWMAASRADAQRLGVAVVTLAAAATAMLPILLPYRQIHERWDLHRNIDEMISFSADLASITAAAPALWLRPLPKLIDKPEADVYPGLAVVACLAAGALAWRHARTACPGPALPAWTRWLRRILAAVALVAGLAAIIGLVRGPFGFDLGPLRVSVTSLNKPIGAALSALLLIAVLSPRVWWSAQRGSLVGLYVAVFVASTILMLGPEGQVMGARFWYKAPFAWLLELPGFDTVRVPARWATIQVLAASVLAAIAVKTWRPRRDDPRSGLAVAALAAAIVAEGWYSLPVVTPPAPVTAPLTADLVVELPTHGWVEDVAAMYRGMWHQRRVVNGYSGFGPPHYAYLSVDLQAGCLDSLEAVRRGRSLDIVIHTDARDGAQVRAAVLRHWPEAHDTVAGPLIVRHVPADRDAAKTAFDDPIDLSRYCEAARLAAAETR